MIDLVIFQIDLPQWIMQIWRIAQRNAELLPRLLVGLLVLLIVMVLSDFIGDK